MGSMKRYSDKFGRGILAAAALGFGFALAVPATMAAETPTKVKDAGRIDAEIRTKGQTRVIVHVATGLDERTVDRRLRNREERGQTLRDLRARVEPVMLSYFPGRRGDSGRIVKSIDSIGGFAADVTLSELDRMKADPRILKIEIDEFKTTNLNQSLPLIGLSSQAADIDAQPNGTDAKGIPTAVAVIDTGVERTHPFIGQARVVAEACFLTDRASTCPNGAYDMVGPGAATPASGEDHGTHVSGIAMGHYQSGSPVNRGVASKANLVMVNVFGSQGGAYTSDIIQGLQFVYSLVVNNNANDNPYRIAAVNMSLGGGNSSDDCDSSLEKQSIDQLRDAGVITVVAAGNDSSKTQMSSPACISSAFSVAATNKTGGIASYSNISRTTDVFAPGGDFGTNGCITSSVLGGKYAAYCGTSMATPHVAGAVALLRTAKPGASVAEIEMALKSSGNMVRDTRSGGVYSAPLINIPKALDLLANPQPVTLDATVYGAGTLYSQPTGLSCGKTCSTSFVKGQTVTLMAVPSETSVLNSWTGGTSQCSTAATCTITMDQSKSAEASFVTANWVRPIPTVLDNSLTWLNPADTNLASWYGQNRTLRSGDTTGYAISSDIGDTQSAALETSVTGPGTLSFFWSVSSEASYDYLEFWINGVKQTGSISGAVAWTQRSFNLPSGVQRLRWVYRKDEAVSSGSDAGFLDRVIFTPGNVTATTYSLRVTKSSGSRYGTVSSSPTGINCGTSCSSQTASFAASTPVTLTALANSGRRFSGWSGGGCSDTQATCTVTMNAALTVNATFR